MNDDRREYLRLGLVSLLGYTCCGASHSFEMGKSAEPQRKSTDVTLPDSISQACNGGECSSAIAGCSIVGNASTALKAAYSGDGVLSLSQNTPLQKLLAVEHPILTEAMGVRPGVFPFDDSRSPNALATPQVIQGNPYPDGTVLMGVTLMRKISEKFGGSLNNASVLSVLAHEFGHIAQFKFSMANRWQMPRGKTPELHADFLAGWYLMQKLKVTMGTDTPNGRFHFQGAASQVYSMGDLNFNDQAHHGTHGERMQAFLGGANLAAANNNFQPFWQVFEMGRNFVGLS